jgi:hypothetical protein
MTLFKTLFSFRHPSWCGSSLTARTMANGSCLSCRWVTVQGVVGGHTFWLVMLVMAVKALVPLSVRVPP